MNFKFFSSKIIHVLVWGLYLILQLIFLSNIFPLEVSFYESLKTTIILASIFYINIFVLMPRYIDNNRILKYSLSLIILFVVFLILFYLLNKYFKPFGEIHPIMRGFSPTGNPDFVRNHPDKNDLGEIIRNVMRNFSSITIIVLISIIYRTFIQKINDEKRKTEIINEHLQSEMKFLKSQVNPHFLFNAINNIYTLVHLKSDIAPAMLIKLSDMLRYMLYESNDDLVNIDKEISYINDYIDMQQLKTEHSQNITTKFDVIDNTVKVPPLLFIPFIENSFKHCKIMDTDSEWISMSLKATHRNIRFEIVNSKNSTDFSKDKTGGIGLENVKRRLQLIYPNKYSLEINNLQDQFDVTLIINI